MISDLVFMFLLFHIFVLYSCFEPFQEFKMVELSSDFFSRNIVSIGCFDFVQFLFCVCECPIGVNCYG